MVGRKYAEATVKSGRVVGYTIKPTPSVELSELAAGDIALTGFALPVTFKAKGTGPDGLAQSLYMSVSTTTEKGYWKTSQLVIVGNGETKDIKMTWTPKDVGTYTIWICADREGQQVVGELTDINVRKGCGSTNTGLLKFDTLMGVSVNNTLKKHSVDEDGRLITLVGTKDFYGSFTVKINRGLSSMVSTALYKYNTETKKYIFHKSGESGWLAAEAGAQYNGHISFPGLAEGTYLFVVGLGLSKVEQPLENTNKLYWYNDAYCFTISEATAIDTPRANRGDTVSIHTLRGTKVATVKRSEVDRFLQSLPHGIYVVDGKKVAR